MAIALIVDDSRPVRMFLRRTLQELGFEVREAGNGREALALLAVEKAPVDVGLVDWNMPEMDGLELLSSLRNVPKFNSMVIIMVTAETELDRIAEALNAGADEYIMKPFTKEILIGKLELAGIHL
jgi:two-component system, chemotaxis family, chemotaxis protein CheY